MLRIVLVWASAVPAAGLTLWSWVRQTGRLNQRRLEAVLDATDRRSPVTGASEGHSPAPQVHLVAT